MRNIAKKHRSRNGPTGQDAPFLPMSLQEAGARGWNELDVIIVSGDAYLDHPAFAPALLGRLLESKGYRVGIIARPDPEKPEEMARLGRPRLFFAVSPGAVDSMVNNYTAQKRPRRSDDYAPGGKGGGRPNRALIVYCNLIRRQFGKSVGILAGGVEASLRRLAHYDFWDDKVRRAILLDAPADTLVYGMGESPLIEIAERMKKSTDAPGTPSEKLGEIGKSVRGVAWRCAASQAAPEGYKQLSSFEEITSDAKAHAAAFKDEMQHRNDGVYQDCAGHRIVVNPPAEALSTAELDAIYALPFRRLEHPSYEESVPALAQVQFSVTSHRGCFGGCAFCGITSHQGKTVQSRSRKSILDEVREMIRHPDFHGTIRDIGGPTANMWGLHCHHDKPCARPSCLAPEICPHLETNGMPYVELLDEARRIEGVKHLFIGSGVRMDLALKCEPFIEAMAAHYTSGLAKVAPEQVVPHVLKLMLKPDGRAFLQFLKKFRDASKKAGKEQFLLPYLIAAHPGSRMEDMIEVALFLKKERLRVEQCQIFIPLPGTASAVMYSTGINPFDGKPVFVEKNVRKREMQKALVLYHLPESAKLVREALVECGRRDLIPALVSRSTGGKRATR